VTGLSGEKTLTAPGEFTGRDFRDVLGGFATGVNIITTRGEDHAYGMTATAFSSVSLDPPLILVCIGTTATGSEMIRRNGVFAVNILSAGQEPISRFFASKDRPRGRDAFRGVPHHEAVSGSPILEDAAGWVDCSLDAVHEAGDHHILIGEVLALGIDREARPLLFHGGTYCFLE
jgi:3-hydroxy-9,10-secoandrosta-1,3,5(10)-triene-9,17-dione monooxygenase reductase component